MKIERLLFALLVFFFGVFIASIANFYLLYSTEKPLLKNFSFNIYKESVAPSDFIKEDQIEVLNDKIIIKVNNATIGRYAPTGSMKPLLDENSNGIRIVPKGENDIHIGDIITFVQDDTLIIHRVIEINYDEKGIYYITKGDNNSLVDKKVRFKDIKYLTIGILW
jgi:hypothetical protein